MELHQKGGAGKMNLDAIIEKIMGRVRLMVGRCVILASKYNDGELLADVELVAGEKRRGIEFLQQFGFSSRPKGDVEGVVLFIGGSRDNGVVIATRGECPKLKEGEVKIHSAFGSSLLLKDDGSIVITPASGKNVVAESNLLCMGKLLATQDVVAGVTDAGGTVIESGGFSLMTHMHPTASPGSPSTPTPKP